MRKNNSIRHQYGSEHYLLDYDGGSGSDNPWDKEFRSYASGRDALRSLLNYGQKEIGWRRLWVPSYFCQEVVASLKSTGISIELYDDSPTDESCALDIRNVRDGDAMLNVNFMGLRLQRETELYGALAVIEDHTHDPWSTWASESPADWCVASLRKTLPIPDGAVLWSPRKRALPEQLMCMPERAYASLNKMAGMILKKRYLMGDDICKDDYMRLYRFGEEHIASNETSGISVWSGNLLNTFPTRSWRGKRLNNYRAFGRVIQDVPFVRLLKPESEECSSPFSCLIVFDSPDMRDFVRMRLLERDVYPSVLWPLHEPVIDGIPVRHQMLSRKILSIPCDMRYCEEDMACIAGIIGNAVHEWAVT